MLSEASLRLSAAALWLVAASAVGQPAGESCPALQTSALARQAAEFYIGSKHYLACHAAATALLEFRNRTGTYEVHVREEDQTEYSTLMDNYVEGCLFSLDREVAPRILGATATAQLRRSVGYIYFAGSLKPFHCNALRIGQRVLTARHCFGHATVRVPAESRFKAIADSSEGLALTLSSKYHPMTPVRFRPEDDWLILDLSQNAPGAPPPIRVRVAHQWDQALVISFDPRLIVLPQPKPVTAADRKALDPFVDLSPLCRVALLQPPFFFHACQSEVGTSGSPFLTVSGSDQLSLAGVHSGQSPNITDACNERRAEIFRNYATALPTQVMRMLNEEQGLANPTHYRRRRGAPDSPHPRRPRAVKGASFDTAH
jgi:hypothetical protein